MTKIGRTIGLAAPLSLILFLLLAGCGRDAEGRAERAMEDRTKDRAPAESGVPAATLEGGAGSHPEASSFTAPPGEVPATDGSPAADRPDDRVVASRETAPPAETDMSTDASLSGDASPAASAAEPGAERSTDTIPDAPMGRTTAASALTNAEGYVPPADPEAESVLRGRRDVPKRDVAFMAGEPTAEDLARAVLTALENGDSKRLHDLRVTAQEFAEILWPEMPQSRPITNTRAEDAWFFVDAGSHSGMSAALAAWGGTHLELVSLRYDTGRASYTNFNLYRGVRIRARTAAGEEVDVDAVATFAECGGVWKVYAFKD
jgi:hypothetical protein